MISSAELTYFVEIQLIHDISRKITEQIIKLEIECMKELEGFSIKQQDQILI